MTQYIVTICTQPIATAIDMTSILVLLLPQKMQNHQRKFFFSYRKKLTPITNLKRVKLFR